MRLKQIIFLVLLHFGVGLKAQPPLDWNTVSTIGGGFQDYVQDVFVDAAGNTYACGTFRGPLTIGSDNLFTNSAGQIFIAKYDNTGAPLWAIQSNGNSQAFATSIFVDALGYVYVSGYHNHSVISFAGLSLPSSSNEGFYVVKVSPNGLPLHLTGPTFATPNKSRAYGIVGDGDYIYVTGTHLGAINLPGPSSLPVSQGQNDVFVARVDSALTSFTYAFSHGGTEDDVSTDIAISGLNLFLTGSYGNAPCTFVSLSPDYVLPAYGQKSMWVTACNKTNGNVLWSNSAGSSVGPSTANAVTTDGTSVFITGACSDICTFNDTPSPLGPFVYNDTIFSNGKLDAFVAVYDFSGTIQNDWSDGSTGDDIGYGITYDPTCSSIHYCGNFENTVNFGGVTPLIASAKDLFVASYSIGGIFNSAFNELSTANETAYAIHSSAVRTSFGGELYGDAYFGTIPVQAVAWNGINDHFVSSFQCSTVPPCGPVINACLPNDTVVANNSCTSILANYTSLLSVTDGCSTGIVVTQDPPPLNILSAGVHEITLTATDGGGNTDVCIFNVVVKNNQDPILVNCGDQFFNQTSGGSGNDFSSLSCSSLATPGQDILYQITVDDGNHFLQIKMSNGIDSNDPYAYVYWLNNNCPNTGVCVEVDSFNVSSDQFSNNSQYLTFIADGPGTYYFIVDAKTDSIESFDIEFTCTSSGIEFDNSGCDVLDTDNDGIVPFVNGSNADLTMQPCESVTICHDIYIANINDWEWLDSVQMKLGDCYENINPLTLTPNAPPNDNGFYNALGEWTGTYNAGTNEIIWEFAHSSQNPWGDGSTGQYGCQLYTFCFEADITSTCATSEELNIGIAISDDGGKGIGYPSTIFDIGNSNDFILQDDDPTFTYPTAILCNADPNIAPDNIITSGGLFTASVGIIFTDGSPSPTGTIDLTASTIGGPYTITHTVGLCPFTHDFVVDIFAQEDPSFSYSAAAFCQGDTDPSALITGTMGGTFSANANIFFIDNLTGEIDLSMSTAGGPYWIVYTTPGPNCVNVDSVEVTINPEDDASFNYSANSYCQADGNQSPVLVTTPGGTFDEITSDVIIVPSTGVVDLVTSVVGNYYITYTTSGICPNVDSVIFDILIEDNPNFNYASIAYCQGDANPVGNITGTTGGTFSGPAGISFVSTASGEIDLMGSTAGGPYSITYTTPGPTCPNSATFDITINPEDDSTFSYLSNIFCLGDGNQFPTITGTPGGFFTSSAGISIVSSSTGEVDVLGSMIGGPHTITYTSPGPNCPNSMTVTVNIYVEDDPTMSYLTNTFCANETNPVATVTMPGGTFSGPVTFADFNTGEIDLAGSTPGGPYEIVYTTPGPECPNTDTAFITIIALDDPTFNYLSNDFCTSEINAVPTISGFVGGIFSADTNLLIDSNTGSIDLIASNSGGPYSIQYLTSGTCPDSATVTVNIYQAPMSDAGPDQMLFLIYDTQLQAVNPTVGTGIWSILTGQGTVVDETDSASWINDLEEGTTSLLWTVLNGSCPAAVDTMIIIVGGLFIPEAITPNDDNQNDLFFIEGIESLTNHVDIFNRWGQKVYEADDYQNDWGGNDSNGNELTGDTYFYVITAGEFTFKGFVVIKR